MKFDFKLLLTGTPLQNSTKVTAATIVAITATATTASTNPH
jgi:hypothetical protein